MVRGCPTVRPLHLERRRRHRQRRRGQAIVRCPTQHLVSYQQNCLSRLTMILLPPENTIIQHVLTQRFAKPGAVDQTFSDFDGVAYHVESAKTGPMTLSMDIRCWNELASYGAHDVLAREYGAYLVPDSEVEQGYSVSLRFDYDQLPPEGEERTALIQSVSLLKRNTMAAPFEKAFATHAQLASETKVVEGAASAVAAEAKDILTIPYREDEAIYVIPAADRVTVVFSTEFKDETDTVFGRVFLQVRTF